ncbi:MAG: bifunctional riboflavin kinase/FAD synthetase [Paludibacteraceae bacterium]|nr:bifunctional riboflavin kinase/FAD synthetase [Paludibacteraceae bacterium]
MNKAATIGFFDGVHLGHRFLLAQLRATAEREGLESAVVTFREHPKMLLTGQSPALLTTTEERLRLLSQTGIDHLICLDFAAVQQLTAEAFMRLLHEQYGVDILLMGYDHRFGSDRLTAIDDYIARGEAAGIRVRLQEQAPAGAVSSTRIRRALQAGHISEANELLGYAYTLSGTVVHGRGLGHQLGFPTANIEPESLKLIPAPGVYATRISLSDNNPSITNIGSNPTVGNTNTTIETHIPDFKGDLYGRHVTLTFLRRIRGEQRFPSLDALRRQIAADIRQLD